MEGESGEQVGGEMECVTSSAIFTTTCVFNAPGEGVPLEIGYRPRVRRNQDDAATRWWKVLKQV